MAYHFTSIRFPQKSRTSPTSIFVDSRLATTYNPRQRSIHDRFTRFTRWSVQNIGTVRPSVLRRDRGVQPLTMCYPRVVTVYSVSSPVSNSRMHCSELTIHVCRNTTVWRLPHLAHPWLRDGLYSDRRAGSRYNDKSCHSILHRRHCRCTAAHAASSIKLHSIYRLRLYSYIPHVLLYRERTN